MCCILPCIWTILEADVHDAQYGDIASSAVVFDWQRQLSKWASVQDRLREWVPSVRAKIETFSCLQIMMLDIDGFRLDKATQITVDALGDFSSAMRQCASLMGKDNFIITGEIAGGNNFGSVYLGRGRQPDMKVETLPQAFQMSNSSNSSSFIRDLGQNALDGAAFHYSIYRSLTRFLGLDGHIEGGQDVPVNFIEAWNEMILTNDLVNANTNAFDPRHMFGMSRNRCTNHTSLTFANLRTQVLPTKTLSDGRQLPTAPRECSLASLSLRYSCQVYLSCSGERSKPSIHLTTQQAIMSLEDRQ